MFDILNQNTESQNTDFLEKYFIEKYDVVRGYLKIDPQILDKCKIGIPPNLNQQERKILWFLAAQTHRKDIIQKLLAETPELIETTKSQQDRRTALHWAAYEGDEAMIVLLITHGANTEIRDHKNRTALHIAAERGYDKVVQVLVTQDANTEALDSQNRTALHIAAERGYDKVSQVLVTQGENGWLKNRFFHTADMIANLTGYSEIRTLFYHKRVDDVLIFFTKIWANLYSNVSNIVSWKKDSEINNSPPWNTDCFLNTLMSQSALSQKNREDKIYYLSKPLNPNEVSVSDRIHQPSKKTRLK